MKLKETDYKHRLLIYMNTAMSDPLWFNFLASLEHDLLFVLEDKLMELGDYNISLDLCIAMDKI